MKNIYITLVLVIALVFKVSASLASVVKPGMIENFEFGKPRSWTKAIEKDIAEKLPPVVIFNNDENNHYLEVQSRGVINSDPKARDAHSRMVVFNEGEWTGDYSGITSIAAEMKATSSTEDYLYMRLAIFDEKVSGESQSRYVSSNAQLLKADGSDWQTLTFSLAPEDLTRFRGEKQAEEVLKNVSHLRFLSSKNEAKAWDVDKIKATLNIDNITAVSAVPLPGAVWLMISGILSLVGMSLSKRHIP